MKSALYIFVLVIFVFGSFAYAQPPLEPKPVIPKPISPKIPTANNLTCPKTVTIDIFVTVENNGAWRGDTQDLIGTKIGTIQRAFTFKATLQDTMLVCEYEAADGYVDSLWQYAPKGTICEVKQILSPLGGGRGYAFNYQFSCTAQ
jgi:hypothetical protein